MIVELGAEVRHGHPRLPCAGRPYAQGIARKLVERSGVGSGDFDRAVDGRRYRKIGEGSGNVIGRDRLEQSRRQPNRVACWRRISTMPPTNSKNCVARK